MRAITTLLAILLLAGSIGLGATSVMALEVEFGDLPDQIQDWENDGPQ